MALIARKYFLCDLINDTAQVTTKQQPGMEQLQQVKAVKLSYLSDAQIEQLFDNQAYAEYGLSDLGLTIQRELALSHLRIYQEVANNSSIADDDLFLVVEEGVILASDWQARLQSMVQYFEQYPSLNLLLLTNNTLQDFSCPAMNPETLEHQAAILTRDGEIQTQYNFLEQEQHFVFATGLRNPNSKCYLMRKRAIKHIANSTFSVDHALLGITDPNLDLSRLQLSSISHSTTDDANSASNSGATQWETTRQQELIKNKINWLSHHFHKLFEFELRTIAHAVPNLAVGLFHYDGSQLLSAVKAKSLNYQLSQQLNLLHINYYPSKEQAQEQAKLSLASAKEIAQEIANNPLAKYRASLQQSRRSNEVDYYLAQILTSQKSQQNSVATHAFTYLSERDSLTQTPDWSQYNFKRVNGNPLAVDVFGNVENELDTDKLATDSYQESLPVIDFAQVNEHFSGNFLANVPKYVISDSGEQRLQANPTLANFFKQDHTSDFVPVILGCNNDPSLSAQLEKLTFNEDTFIKEAKDSEQAKTLNKWRNNLAVRNLYREIANNAQLTDEQWVLIARDNILLDPHWYHKLNALLGHTINNIPEAQTLNLEKATIKDFLWRSYEQLSQARVYTQEQYINDLGFVTPAYRQLWSKEELYTNYRNFIAPWFSDDHLFSWQAKTQLLRVYQEQNLVKDIAGDKLAMVNYLTDQLGDKITYDNSPEQTVVEDSQALTNSEASQYNGIYSPNSLLYRPFSQNLQVTLTTEQSNTTAEQSRTATATINLTSAQEVTDPQQLLSYYLQQLANYWQVMTKGQVTDAQELRANFTQFLTANPDIASQASHAVSYPSIAHLLSNYHLRLELQDTVTSGIAKKTQKLNPNQTATSNFNHLALPLQVTPLVQGNYYGWNYFPQLLSIVSATTYNISVPSFYMVKVGQLRNNLSWIESDDFDYCNITRLTSCQISNILHCNPMLAVSLPLNSHLVTDEFVDNWCDIHINSWQDTMPTQTLETIATNNSNTTNEGSITATDNSSGVAKNKTVSLGFANDLLVNSQGKSLALITAQQQLLQQHGFNEKSKGVDELVQATSATDNQDNGSESFTKLIEAVSHANSKTTQLEEISYKQLTAKAQEKKAFTPALPLNTPTPKVAKLRKFLINLDSQPERLDFMRAQPGLETFERRSAVWGSSLTDEEKAEFFDVPRYEALLRRPPVGGEYGCTLSHCRIYQEVLADDTIAENDFVLISEDDSSFHPLWQQRLETVLEYLEANKLDNVNLILAAHIFLSNLDKLPANKVELTQYLYIQGKDRLVVSPEQEMYYMYKFYPHGSSCYLVRKKALATMVANINKPFWVADDFPYVAKFTPNSYLVLNPPLSSQNTDLPSTISQQRYSSILDSRKRLQEVDLDLCHDDWMTPHYYVIQRHLSTKEIAEKFPGYQIIPYQDYREMTQEEFDKWYDKQGFINNYGREPTDDEINHALAHLRALRFVGSQPDNHFKFCLFVEDSATVHPQLKQLGNTFIRYLDTRLGLHTYFINLSNSKVPQALTKYSKEELANYVPLKEDGYYRINHDHDTYYMTKHDCYGCLAYLMLNSTVKDADFLARRCSWLADDFGRYLLGGTNTALYVNPCPVAPAGTPMTLPSYPTPKE